MKFLEMLFGPSVGELRAAEHVREAAQLRAEMEEMRSALFGKDKDIERLRDRGPARDTIELTIRAWSPSGEPIAVKYQLHRMQLDGFDHDEVGDILANRCRALYRGVALKA